MGGQANHRPLFSAIMPRVVSLKMDKQMPGKIFKKSKSPDWYWLPLDDDMLNGGGETVYCGRKIERGGWSLAESRFSNRVVGEPNLENYAKLLEKRGIKRQDLLDLRGKDLACWCWGKKKDGAKCHAFLLKQLVRRARK